MVSIIVPVYNAQLYLEKCVDSLVNQTFRDIEIILVNDGSTDKSLSVCEAFQKKDNRIRIMSQENAGQGAARNRGIRAARGEYIMFVDSDDWVDECIIEKLMDSLLDNDADIAVCNLYRTVKNEEEIAVKYEEVFCDGCLDRGRDKNYVFRISSYPVGKLYKTELLKKADFSFPEHFFEDVAAIPILFAYAGRISFTGRGFYFYRNHMGSTTNDFNKLDDRIKCLYSLVEIFKKHHLFEQYRDEMEAYICRRLKINYRMVKRVFNSYCRSFADSQNDFYSLYFQGKGRMEKFNTVTWGSYNLYTVSKIIMNSEPDEILKEYYGFQSIISLMNKRTQEMRFALALTENSFRQMGIINDFTNRFLQKSIMEFSDTDAVLVDFLEERYDIGVRNGNYFTLSDGFLETQYAKTVEYERLARFDENTTELWKESCSRFIELLKQYVAPEKIVLVRMKLCEHYGVNHDGISGKERIAYPEAEKIKKMNELLDMYYDYFEAKCPQAAVIDNLSEKDFYYTSQQFRHGCYPWHINQTAYSKISELILEKLHR